jgi:hypothetical protein
MGARFTRRQFLAGVGSGAAYFALANAVGCEPAERISRAKPAQHGRAGAPGSRPSSEGGAWAFRSRPDLSPPTVEVAKEAHDTASGYVFIAPEQGDAGQGGSLIIDNRGQIVWFRPLRHPIKPSSRAMNFEAQTYRGRPVLTWGETPGEYVIFDSSYRELARFGAANGYSGDHHEFLISPQDTALITIYDRVPHDLSSLGGPNLLVSARKTSAVYKIDRNSGEIIWRLGGKKSDFEIGPGASFAFQHDARRLPEGNISIFDNGTTVFQKGFPKAIEESRAIVLELDEERMRSSLVAEYTHPDKKEYADAAGNTQVLNNGDVFVGWGRALAISEFSKDGELLLDLRLQPDNRSYRAFRFPWSGYPSDQPTAVAERISEEEVRVYASWNGATEVATWEVLAGSKAGRLRSLQSIPRDGFETAMVVRTSDPYVAVQAKDRSGRVLGTSKAVAPGR